MQTQGHQTNLTPGRIQDPPLHATTSQPLMRGARIICRRAASIMPKAHHGRGAATSFPHLRTASPKRDLVPPALFCAFLGILARKATRRHRLRSAHRRLTAPLRTTQPFPPLSKKSIDFSGTLSGAQGGPPPQGSPTNRPRLRTASQRGSSEGERSSHPSKIKTGVPFLVLR